MIFLIITDHIRVSMVYPGFVPLPHPAPFKFLWRWRIAFRSFYRMDVAPQTDNGQRDKRKNGCVSLSVCLLDGAWHVLGRGRWGFEAVKVTADLSERRKVMAAYCWEGWLLVMNMNMNLFNHNNNSTD